MRSGPDAVQQRAWEPEYAAVETGLGAPEGILRLRVPMAKGKMTISNNSFQSQPRESKWEEGCSFAKELNEDRFQPIRYKQNLRLH